MTKRIAYVGALALLAGAVLVRAQGQAPAPAPAPAPAAPAAPGQTPAGPAGQAPGGGGRPGGRGGPSPGQLLFVDQCAGCHGNDAAGGRAPSLFDQKWLDSTTDEKIAAAIKNGVRNTEMEAFPTLTGDQIFQLIGHIRTMTGAALRPRPAFVDKPDGLLVNSEKQSFKIEVVGDGLMSPWGLAFLPDGRMLVTERDGRLQLIDKTGKLTLVTGTPKGHVQQDGGYLDVVIHPRYATNGWVYLTYAEDQPGYVAPPPPPPPDPNAPPPAAPAGRGGRGGPPQVPSMTVIVRGKISKTNEWTDQQVIWRAPVELYTSSGAHYGTRLLFDKENHLFFGMGDRNTNNPNPAQDLKSPLGKVHRFNDDGTTPKDNPFVSTPGAVGSIWTYGHRNPEGLAWDPVTGALWESEHGPNTADEVNVLVKGHNYGWNLVSKQGPPTYKISEAGMDDPVTYFAPTFAPSGIAFYTGTKYAGWKNTSLFVSGLAGQALKRFEVKDNKVVRQETVFDNLGRVRDIKQGPDGLFYVLVQNPTGVPNPNGTGNIALSASTPGRVVRLAPVAATAAPAKKKQ
jgi:glucose/arabinose dehydrogenase/cytochrome c5